AMSNGVSSSPTWSTQRRSDPCSSPSMTRTRLPVAATVAAISATVVVLPTPPFWLQTVTIRVIMGWLLRASVVNTLPEIRGYEKPNLRTSVLGVSGALGGVVVHDLFGQLTAPGLVCIDLRLVPFDEGAEDFVDHVVVLGDPERRVLGLRQLESD